MQQMESSVASLVRQAVKETLAGLQVTDTQEHSELNANEVEEEFGAQLDQLLGRFG
jgi:hypothetical protein